MVVGFDGYFIGYVPLKGCANRKSSWKETREHTAAGDCSWNVFLRMFDLEQHNGMNN